MDNGTEYIVELIIVRSMINEINFHYIQHGKTTKKLHIERFNKYYREGVLDAYLFSDLNEVREITHHWVEDYNHYRPHDTLNGMSPVNYRISNETKDSINSFENERYVNQIKKNKELCTN